MLPYLLYFFKQFAVFIIARINTNGGTKSTLFLFKFFYQSAASALFKTLLKTLWLFLKYLVYET